MNANALSRVLLADDDERLQVAMRPQLRAAHSVPEVSKALSVATTRRTRST